jgi:hypothetical protein
MSRLTDGWAKDHKQLNAMITRASRVFRKEKPSNVVFVCMVHLMAAIDSMDDVAADEAIQTVINIIDHMTETVEETLQ